MAKEHEFKLSSSSSLCLFDSIPLQDLPPASPHDPLQQISQAVHEFKALGHDDTFYDNMGWHSKQRVTRFGYTSPKSREQSSRLRQLPTELYQQLLSRLSVEWRICLA
jgi:hypothetical protein